MKTFTNRTPKSFAEASQMAAQPNAALAGGGSDLLQLVKDHLVEPDTIVHLRGIKDANQIRESADGLHIGALTTLDEIAHNPVVQRSYKVLADAAGSVATQQIRNVGTIAGNLNQRPWCWYYRNGFACYKNGGKQCFSVVGENEFHAIFGGGPSYMVHPSDTAPALVALGAAFELEGAGGVRKVAAADYFQGPREDPARETVLKPGEVMRGVVVPKPKAGTRSLYHKVLDREAWTHAVVSAAIVLEMDGANCRSARIVLGGVAPIPWRVEKAEQVLVGQRISEETAQRAADAALEGARPLARNAYKAPLTKTILRRSLMELA
jgi:xanthine dehydrogenase YagS FAD-binding subunit